MQFRICHLLISLISFGMLYGCASSEPASTSTATSTPTSDDSAPSADQESKQSLSAAYVNAALGVSNKRYRNCLDIEDVKTAVKKTGALDCLQLMIAGESKDYFNQQTHFLIQCRNKSFSTSTIESNIRAEFDENSADLIISIPRADVKLPDTIRVNSMVMNKYRNALMQSDSTEVIFLRGDKPWQGTSGEALNFDVAIGFAQVFYIRPDSPDRIWKFEQTYLEIKAQYADSCQLKVIAGSSIESSSEGNRLKNSLG